MEKKKRAKVQGSDRLKAVQAYLRHENTLRELGEKYGVHHSAVEKWVNNYNTFGEKGVTSQAQNSKYSEELKRKAVYTYQTTSMGLYRVCQIFKIRTPSLLQTWIAKYGDQEKKR